MYLKDKFNQELFGGLEMKYRQLDHKAISRQDPTEFPTVLHFNDDAIPEKIWNIIFTTQLVDLANQFKRFILTEEERIKKIISQTIDIERDMVDLI